MAKQLKEYKSPTHKVLQLIQTSRDKLRMKYGVCRQQLRSQQNQVRAVEKSRSMWKRRAEDAERELQELKKRERLATSLAPGKY